HQFHPSVGQHGELNAHSIVTLSPANRARHRCIQSVNELAIVIVTCMRHTLSIHWPSEMFHCFRTAHKFIDSHLERALATHRHCTDETLRSHPLRCCTTAQ